MTTGSSNVMPNASSMREANDRYSLMRICGATPMVPYSCEEEAEADREDDHVAEAAPAMKKNVRGDDERHGA